MSRGAIPSVHALLSTVFAEGCRLCEQPLDPAFRAGVCRGCWARVRPATRRACLRCGLPGDEAGRTDPLCLGCQQEAPWFDRARSWGRYRGELAAALRLLKYARLPETAAPLADRLLQDRETADFLGDCHLLVPVPLHPARRRQRGYDQARLLCRHLARRLRLPLVQGLRRARATRPQVGLGAAARRRNVRGAFRPGRDENLLRGRRVCLVDDVWTTGATLREACRVLTRMRPGEIRVFTAARA